MKRFVLAATAALMAAAAAAQTDPVSRAIDATTQANKASAASQQRVNQLDDQTQTMLERYRAATWQAQQLRVYANQIEPLLAAQDAEKQALQRQLAELDRAGGDLTPLMLRMLESLEAYQIEADYGRALGTERAEAEGRIVEVLRVGRTALFAVALDGADAWTWDTAGRKWQPVERRYVSDLRKAMKMARETAAPDLLTLPMPVASAEAAR